VLDAIPDTVDLFAVAVAAGLNVRLAVAAVASRAPPGPVAEALGRVEAEVAGAGERLADALDRLPEWLGEPIRPLSRALVDAERYGTPLGASLDRIADDARRARQQRAQEAARRIPVQLLLPLVTCILPAFGLLTVAPLIAGGLRALRL
jgi:pilus assembly protein TadC